MGGRRRGFACLPAVSLSSPFFCFSIIPFFDGNRKMDMYIYTGQRLISKFLAFYVNYVYFSLRECISRTSSVGIRYRKLPTGRYIACRTRISCVGRTSMANLIVANLYEDVCESCTRAWRCWVETRYTLDVYIDPWEEIYISTYIYNTTYVP